MELEKRLLEKTSGYVSRHIVRTIRILIIMATDQSKMPYRFGYKGMPFQQKALKLKMLLVGCIMSLMHDFVLFLKAALT